MLRDVDSEKPRKTDATQHKNQVAVIWGAVSEGFELSEIFDRTLVRDRFLNHFSKEQKPGTAKSYLTSLRKFIRYIDANRIAPSYSSTSILASISEWMTTASKKQRQKHVALQIANQPSRQDVKEFEESGSSKSYKHAIDCLRRISEGYILPIPEDVYNDMQNYLIGRLIEASGQMASAVRHLTIGDFKKRNHFTNDDGTRYALMEVKQHQLSFKWAATVPMNMEVEYLMSVFLENVRKPLQTSRKNKSLGVFDHFFVQYDGHHIRTNAFSKLLLKFRIPLNASLLQRTTTVRVPDIDPRRGKNLVDQTHRSSFDLSQVQKCCVLMTPFLSTNIQDKSTGGGTTYTDIDAEVTSRGQRSVIFDYENNQSGETFPVGFANAATIVAEKEETVDIVGVEYGPAPPAEGSMLVSRGEKWPPRRTAIAHRLFRQFIETDNFPRFDDVRRVLSQTAQGAELEQIYGHLKIRDKICSIIRKNRRCMAERE